LRFQPSYIDIGIFGGPINLLFILRSGLLGAQYSLRAMLFVQCCKDVLAGRLRPVGTKELCFRSFSVSFRY